MDELGTTEHAKHTVLITDDWASYFESIVGNNEGIEDANGPPIDSEPATGVNEDDTEQLMNKAKEAAFDMFVDAHNAGYYINSYTTKLNPTMDMVLRRLLDGVRRLADEWEAKDAQRTAEYVPQARRAFGRTVQMLNKFQSAFLRASWKSGCEMLLPIL